MEKENKPNFSDMIEKNVRHYKEIVFALAGLALIYYFKEIASGIYSFFAIFESVFYGLVFAFILNVPMKALSSLFEKHGWFKSEKNRNIISLITTLIIVVLLFVIILANVLPNIVSSINDFSTGSGGNVRNVANLIESVGQKFPVLQNILETVDWDSALSSAMSYVNVLLSQVLQSLPDIGGSFATAAIGFILAIYILLDKKNLGRQSKRVLRAMTNEKIYGKVTSFCKLFSDTYYKFFSGQLLESVILGVLMFVTLSLCRFPYAGIIAVMAAIFQFVPYVGTFVACLLGAFLILFTSPTRVIPYLITYLIVQFVEGQFIYPRVVGGSVGLPALFTLIAVIVGGEMFGLLGMLFFIPLASVLYQLFGTLVRNLETKQMNKQA